MKKKYLTRKKAIELCVELWEWLAKTGKRKQGWPDWEKHEQYFYIFNDRAANDCWFCEYDNQQTRKQTNGNQTIGSCNYCPFFQQIGHCNPNEESYYGRWDKAKTSRTRKKYAALFLVQIKTLYERYENANIKITKTTKKAKS